MQFQFKHVKIFHKTATVTTEKISIPWRIGFQYKSKEEMCSILVSRYTIMSHSWQAMYLKLFPDIIRWALPPLSKVPLFSTLRERLANSSIIFFFFWGKCDQWLLELPSPWKACGFGCKEKWSPDSHRFRKAPKTFFNFQLLSEILWPYKQSPFADLGILRIGILCTLIRIFLLPLHITMEEIGVNKLARMWIAEGLVKSKYTSYLNKQAPQKCLIWSIPATI